MYSSERKLQNVNRELLYDKYMLKLMEKGRYNKKEVYIDKNSRIMYYTDGQAVLKFRH
jgi:hypothetical protein